MNLFHTPNIFVYSHKKSCPYQKNVHQDYFSYKPSCMILPCIFYSHEILLQDARSLFDGEESGLVPRPCLQETMLSSAKQLAMVHRSRLDKNSIYLKHSEFKYRSVARTRIDSYIYSLNLLVLSFLCYSQNY